MAGALDAIWKSMVISSGAGAVQNAEILDAATGTTNYTQAIDASTYNQVEGNPLSDFFGKIGNAVSTFANTTINNALSAGINCTTIGSNGTLFDVDGVVACVVMSNQFIFPDYTKVGYPCCKSLKLSAMEGFVKCQNAEVNGSGMTLQEHEAVVSMLNGGVFLE